MTHSNEAVKVQNFKIKCDAEGCGYQQETNITELETWLNVPCPDCGANLLTQKDLDATNLMLGAINGLNVLAALVPQAFQAKEEPLIVEVNPRGTTN